MASYIENNLIRDEKIIRTARVSLWVILPFIIVGFLLLPFFGIGLILWIKAAIIYFCTELGFTNKRVIAKFGFIRRTTIELNIDRIESVQVHQSILGRMFFYGTIIVSGAGNPQAPVPYISDPVYFRRALLQYTSDKSEAA